jgi:hypothetical protein
MTERKGGGSKKQAAIAEFTRIAALYDQGEGVTIPQLAQRFGKSTQAIRYILTKSGALGRGKNSVGATAQSAL